MAQFPLSSYPEETFTIPLFGRVYNCKQRWNTLGFWTLDFNDEDGDPIVEGIKLVTGLDLVKAYPELPFTLRINPVVEPTRDNITKLILEIEPT